MASRRKHGAFFVVARNPSQGAILDGLAQDQKLGRKQQGEEQIWQEEREDALNDK